MPIPVMSFPVIESKGDPFLKGFRGGEEDYRKQMSFPAELLAKELENRKAQIFNQIYGVQAKYEEPMTQQKLEGLKLGNTHQGLVNQFYAPEMQSQIGYRNAETNKVNTLLPEELRKYQLSNIAQQRNISGEGAPSGITSFDRLPPDAKNSIVSRIMSLGFNEQESWNHARAGTDIGDLAQMRGFSRDLSDAPPPKPILTSAGRSQLIRSNMANAGLNAADDFINKGISNYSGEITLGGTPAGFLKDAALGKNKDKQSDFIASSILATDQGFLRGRAVGAPLSQGLLKHTLQTSLTDVKAKFPFVKPEVFQEAMKKVRAGINAINKAENESAMNFSAENSEKSKSNSSKAATEMSDEEIQRELAGM